MTSRETWPVRRYRLREEPSEDLTLTTTPEERLEMVETLSVEAWTLTGKPFPCYERHEMPVVLRPLLQAANAERSIS